MPTGFNVGDVVAGKYRIEAVLGVGGMGVVVAAMHLQLDERVAIKFLLPEALTNPEVVVRFAREARAAVKIKSEHVARVIDVGTLDNGSPYMVMEYLKGADLSEVLERRGTLTIADASEYVLHACEAIAEAHALGIIHRDLKPANLFLMRQTDGLDSVKVLDFGISKMSGLVTTHSGMAITGTLSVMGSPLYMSPEQMSSTRDVDEGTDIWSLGAILYELVTGKPPFNAETIPQLCGMVLQERPRSMRSLRPDVPSGFEAIVMRCLEKDRADRYASVGDLSVALLSFAPRRARRSVERIGRVLETSGTGSITIPPSVAPPPMPGAGDIAPESRAVPEVAVANDQDFARTALYGVRGGPRRAQVLLVGGVSAVVLLLGLGAWLLWGGGEAAPEATADEWVVRPSAEPPPSMHPSQVSPEPVVRQVPPSVAVQPAVAPTVPPVAELPRETLPVAPKQAVPVAPVAVRPAPARVAGPTTGAEGGTSVRRTSGAPFVAPEEARAIGAANPYRSKVPSSTTTPGAPAARAPRSAAKAPPIDDDLYGTRK